MATITIAIPFYNAEKYLEEAILSVLSQTYQDFILILLDDGSSDSSIRIARKFLTDPRVRVISDGENLNLGNRLNQIINITDTEYLARMDADDIMQPTRIEKQIAVLKDNPDIDVLGSNLYSLNEENKIIGKRFDIEDYKIVSVKSFMHPTIVGKTKWFQSNLYDMNAIRIEDAELWLRTHEKSNFKVLGEPLLFYREIGSKYYKKYFAGLSGVFYILKKNKYSFPYIKFAFKYCLSCGIYFAFYLFGKENFLIRNRNEVKMEEIDYKLFIKNEL